MNNRGFVNVVLVVLVVILAGTTGYFALSGRDSISLIDQENPGDEILNENQVADSQSVQAPQVVIKDNNDRDSLKSCFGGGALATNVDKSNWNNFEGYGFAIKYPEQLISVTSTGSSDNTTFEISSLASPHKASIKVYKLRKEAYRARYLHSSPIIYELYSDSWWHDGYVWDASKLEQCNPIHRGKTDNGKYFIYSTGDGDVGAFFVSYFVVLRDVVATDNYEPLVVEFRTGGDGNDPNISSYQSFQDALENIIKTLELRPTSKG
jgi:hypothetical protein